MVRVAVFHGGIRRSWVVYRLDPDVPRLRLGVLEDDVEVVDVTGWS